MIKKVLIFIISFIILYEIYLINSLVLHKKNIYKSNDKNKITHMNNNNKIDNINDFEDYMMIDNYNSTKDNLYSTKDNLYSTKDNIFDIDVNIYNKNNNLLHNISDNDKSHDIINNKLHDIINNTIIPNNNIHDIINDNIHDTNNDINDNTHINFGKPSHIEKNKFILWNFIDPHPWTRIIYKYKENYPFYFFIKIKIPSLNDYNNWKKIIKNLDFDPKLGEIIIPTIDEETALSIANLIIINFKGEIELDEILKKKLIDTSITKAKKYEIVKKKLIEQIMSNLNIKESFINKNENNFDLEINSKKNEINFDLEINSKNNEDNKNFTAYEGCEYSFF